MTQPCSGIAASTDGGRLRHLVSQSSYEVFEGVLADSEPLRNACFRVRHQVYCNERRFFSAADHPNGLETDEHDSHSLHGLLRYRRTGEAVGTVRLVLPRANHHSGLPVYSLVERSGSGAVLLPPVALTAEVSRFAISKDFRCRLDQGWRGAAGAVLDHRDTIPDMVLGLMAMVFRMGTLSGVDYLCAVMEPALLRLLSRFGIRWRAVGPLIEHHGWRQPCVARCDDMMANIATERPDVWSLIADVRSPAALHRSERAQASVAA